MVDAVDSKSTGTCPVPVRFRPSAQDEPHSFQAVLKCRIFTIHFSSARHLIDNLPNNSYIGCSRINLLIRHGNLEVIKFYESIGYATDPILSMCKRLKLDSKFDNPEKEQTL